MANLGLNYPTDIKWERICVSNDMIDQNVCDFEAPAKWRSSLALFKYVPEDEYQVYPRRKIVYLKLAATITGYQPARDEIEGEIDRAGFEADVEENFEQMLDSYRKCTGALIQVTVGVPQDADMAQDKLPYIMDYQPKRRALYTMETKTNQRMSRSVESINVRKASGTTESQEVLDVDMGGSSGWSGKISASAGEQGPGGSLD